MKQNAHATHNHNGLSTHPGDDISGNPGSERRQEGGHRRSGKAFLPCKRSTSRTVGSRALAPGRGCYPQRSTWRRLLRRRPRRRTPPFGNSTLSSQFVEKNGCYRKVAFYDADVAEVVFVMWNADGDYLSTEQVRMALLFSIWNVCKVGTPCPLAYSPLLADAPGLGLWIYHPGECSTRCGRACCEHFASFPVSISTGTAFRHTGTVLITIVGEYHK